MAEEKVEKPRKIEQLLHTDLLQEGFGSTQYDAIARGETKPEDVMDPAFWAHVAPTLKPWDVIRVHHEDGSWYLQALVVDAQKSGAQVEILVSKDLRSKVSIPAEILMRYEVVHRGPRGWSVIRKSDRSVMVENHQTRGAADEWLRDNIYSIEARKAA